ncbi:unnamed protein product [Eruca vesicaria subsp. sativa]|uniref:Uncharacterized protein n=1 Tax=Eruca vesicaria subsp. sativa TaxID=29727 RepID=A0ABC8KDL0_ERUVS|nr:unnamed protein product [Eruca vesicaria subsp. sativa]
MDRSYRDLEARKSRAKDFEKLYMDMSVQKELQARMEKVNEGMILLHELVPGCDKVCLSNNDV